MRLPIICPVWLVYQGAVIWQGLYHLDGDTLTSCRPVMLGGNRPKELKSADDNILGVWKRVTLESRWIVGR